MPDDDSNREIRELRNSISALARQTTTLFWAIVVVAITLIGSLSVYLGSVSTHIAGLDSTCEWLVKAIEKENRERVAWEKEERDIDNAHRQKFDELTTLIYNHLYKTQQGPP